MNKIAEFFKRQIKSIPFWLSAITIILSIVGIILISASTSVQGYSITSLGLINACAIIAIVCIAGGIYLSDRFGPHHWSTVIANLVALVLLAVAFANIIFARAVLASSQFSYDSVNTVGWGVLYQSIVALIMFLIGDILLVVGSFMGKDKEASPAPQEN